jgi:Tfp pilus assembly protein PilO
MNKLVSYLMSILIICALGFIFYWFLIHEPYTKQMEDIENRIKEANDLIDKYKRAQRENKQLEDDIKDMKQKIFRLLCKARGRTLEEFLRELEDDAEKAEIDLDNIRIENVHMDELSSKIPVDLNVGGTYFTIFNFLSLVQERGKLDFSGGALNVASETKSSSIKNMSKFVDMSKPRYNPGEQFPNLRVNLNGEIIIIDENHLRKYKTNELNSCEGL